MGPSITLFSPEDGSAYEPRVVVRGRVGNQEIPSDPVSDVVSLRWSTDSGLLGGEIAFEEDGSFSFDFSTSGQAQELRLYIRAKDRHGNHTEQTLDLYGDRRGPLLVVEGPQEEDVYQERIILAGRVADNESEPPSVEGVGSLSYSFLAVPEMSGTIPFDSQGNFHLILDSSLLSGLQFLEIIAVDRHEHITRKTLKLVQQTPQQTATEGIGPPPEVTIKHPADRSFYGSEVRIEGRLAALSGKSYDLDQLKAMTWDILGTELSGTMAVDKRGAFSFFFSTIGLHGTLALRIRATATDGQTTEESLLLLDDEQGPLLSFPALPAGLYYTSELMLKGRVTNSEDESAQIDEVAGLTYQVPGVPDLTGEISFDFEGYFEIGIQTPTLSGDHFLPVTGADLNGHQSRFSLSILDGNVKPVLSLDSLPDRTAYGARVQAKGTVGDPYAGLERGGIESLLLEIYPAEDFGESTPIEEKLELEPDGSFSYVFSTEELSGTQTLTLRARAKNGNLTELSTTLLEGDSDIPSFKVLSGDNKVQLSFDPVPLTADYTLFYVEGRKAPSLGQRLDSFVSSYNLGGLENGHLYTFQLQAIGLPGQKDLFSKPVEAIPLSPTSLEPTLVGEYEQIRLAWNSYAAIEGYEVWRSTAEKGRYRNISGPISATVYVDQTAQYGRTYHYRVKPTLSGSTVSAAVAGTTLAFPTERLELTALAEQEAVNQVALSGSYAYVAAGKKGLKIIDISDPRQLNQVALVETGDARDVAVKGEYAFVADGSNGIKVIDINDPNRPFIAGSRYTSNALAIITAGNYVFVADGEKGVKVLDISSPKNPLRVATLAASDARSIRLEGNLLYIADAVEGLIVIDVADPENPQLKSRFRTSGALDLDIEGTLLCLALGENGIKILDISDREKIVLIASYDTNFAAGVDLSKSFAFVADGEAGLKVIDISNPAHPVQFETFEAEDARGITVRENYVFLADASGLLRIRILIQGNSFQVASYETDGRAYSVTIAGNSAYIADHQQGVKLVDVSDPAALSNETPAAAFKTDFAEAIAIKGNLAFVADGKGGVKIIDKALNNLIGVFETPGHSYDIVVQDDKAYVAMGSEGLVILDVKDPEKPLALGSFPSWAARDLALQDSLVYLADSSRGLLVIDISEPDGPVEIGGNEQLRAHSLKLQGDYAFAAGSDGFVVLDISDPSAPRIVSTYESDYAEDIALQGNYAYLAEGVRGLTVFDISNPEHPVVVSACDTVYAVGVEVKGEYALVVDSAGLKVVHILIPEWLKQR